MSVPHDHPSVETVEARVRSDRLDRRRVSVPAAVPTDRVLTVVLDGTERHARFRDTEDSVLLRGVYDTPERARDPGDATDRLSEWLENAGLEAGRTVHLDIVEPDYSYGLRVPGESAVYRTGRPPSELADIARDLDTESP